MTQNFVRDQSHTRVMGIINVTPDSFSDGGLYASARKAIEHGRALAAQGAELLDIGGESTRPGASRVSESEEMERVLPVVEGLVSADLGAVQLSVDTMRASVAEACVQAGVHIINDVSGGLADDAMFETVARLDVDYVCQHWRGFGDEMGENAHYDDVVTQVRDELVERLEAAKSAGVSAEHLIADPGLGFAKAGEQDWQLLRNLNQFTSLGYRLLVGASRKRFLGALLDGRPASGRDAATAAVSAWCAQHGVWAVRTHEVAAQVDAVAVMEHLISD